MKSIYKSNGRVNDPFFKSPERSLISPVKILLVFMLALACSAFGQTHVHFDLTLFNANPSTNRIVDVQPLTPFKGNVTTYSTGTNSYFFLSNALAADYGVTIKQRGQAEAIQFQVTITSTNLGVIGAYTNTSVLGVQTHPTSGKAAWSILASDARYVPHGTAGVSISAGGGAVATTNGNLVTISVPVIATDALTNNETRASVFVSDLSAGRSAGGDGGQGDLYVGDDIFLWNSNDDAWVQTLSMGDYVLNVLAANGLTATKLVGQHFGDGSALSNLVAPASLDSRFTSSSGTITANSNTLAATTISATTVNATTVNGNGAGITSLNASQLDAGTVPNARLSTKLQSYIIDDILQASSGGLEIGGFTSGDSIDFTGPLRGKGTLLTNAYGVFLAPTNAGTVGQVPTLTADGVNMAFASVAGIGDLQAVNNLADVASTGQSRTNLGAHNADNITRGTVAAARLPDLSTVYIATSTGNGTNTTLRSPVVLSELATNGINSSALIITSAVVNSSFIGTSNNTPLKFSVDSTEALVIEREWPSQNFSTTFKNGSTNHSASGSGILSGATNTISGPMRDSVIAGGKFNTIEGLTNIFGGAFQYELGNSVIAGGLSNKITYHSTNSGAVGLSFIGGGERNTIYDNGFDHPVIVGGVANILDGTAQSVIVGGGQNEIHNAGYGTIGGGVQNVISNLSTSSPISGVVIFGGSANTASGNNSTVAGGTANFAMKDGSFAAGQNAKSLHTNTFVWADGSQPSGFSSSTNRQFLVLATNGVGINTNNPGTNALSVHGSTRSTQFVLGTNSINSWDDVTNYFTQSGGSSLQTGNSTDATNINLTVTGTLVANEQTNTTLSVANAYFGYTNAGATFNDAGKLVGTNGVTQSGLAAGSYDLNLGVQYKIYTNNGVVITNAFSVRNYGTNKYDFMQYTNGVLGLMAYNTSDNYIFERGLFFYNTNGQTASRIITWADHAGANTPEMMLESTAGIALKPGAINLGASGVIPFIQMGHNANTAGAYTFMSYGPPGITHGIANSLTGQGHSSSLNFRSIGTNGGGGYVYSDPGIMGVSGGDQAEVYGPGGNQSGRGKLGFYTVAPIFNAGSYASYPGIMVFEMGTNSLAMQGTNQFIGNGAGVTNQNYALFQQVFASGATHLTNTLNVWTNVAWTTNNSTMSFDSGSAFTLSNHMIIVNAAGAGKWRVRGNVPIRNAAGVGGNTQTRLYRWNNTPGTIVQGQALYAYYYNTVSASTVGVVTFAAGDVFALQALCAGDFTIGNSGANQDDHVGAILELERQ